MGCSKRPTPPEIRKIGEGKFDVVDLMVIVTIVGILAAIIVPVVMRGLEQSEQKEEIVIEQPAFWTDR